MSFHLFENRTRHSLFSDLHQSGLIEDKSQEGTIKKDHKGKNEI